MGAKLCTLRQPSPLRLPHRYDTDEDDSSTDTNASSLMELMKLKCMKIEKKKLHQQEKKIAKTSRKATLEEWLLSSPGSDREYRSNMASGAQLRRHSPKVCPWDPKCSYVGLCSTLGESFSIDREVVHEEGNRGERLVSLSRSQSAQKKRVSFRLPEESDIHLIYYSHNDSEENL